MAVQIRGSFLNSAPYFHQAIAETEAENEAALAAAVGALQTQLSDLQTTLAHQQQESAAFKTTVEPQLEVRPS